MIAGSSPRPAAAREAATLLLAGLCFGASQQLVVRELVSLLYGEEVVLLFVSAAALAAASLGYGLGARLSPRALARLLLACGVLLLLSPALPRFAVAGLCLLRGDSGPELLLVLALLTFAAAAPFTAVVPALLDRHERPDDRLAALRRGYTCELVGFGLGSTAALALGSAPGLRFAVLAAALVALVHVALDRRAVTFAFTVAAALACATHAPLSKYGADLVYRHKHRLPGAQVLWSVDSPYQRVEVVTAPGRGRMLYLDGLRDLDDRDLGALNHYLARAPATLVRPQNALLIGNGTLSMVPELSAMSDHLTTVELDAAVVDAGARFFTPGEPLARLANWRLVLADGKQYLAATERRFDLIAVDVPSPLTLGEAYLHTREFYALCRARLNPGGVLAIQLSGPLGAATRTPARLVASLRAEFSEVMVADSETAERAFAYAADALPFTAEALRATAVAGERRLLVLAGPELDARIAGAIPLTLDDLDLVLRRGAERLRERYL